MSSIGHKMQNTEQLWKIIQGGQHELEFLRMMVSKQQRDIERLKDEKHDQSLLAKTLKLQMKHFTQKIEMSIKTVSKEQMLIQQTLTVINRDSQILGRQYNEIKTKQYNLKLMNFLKSKSTEHKKDLNETNDQIKQWLTGECIQSMVTHNWKTIIGAKQAKELMQKSMAYLNQVLKRNGTEVSRVQNEIKRIINTITVLFKHIENIWSKMQRHTEIQKDASPAIKLKEFFEKTNMFLESYVPENSGQQQGDILKNTLNTRKHVDEDRIIMHPKKKGNAQMYRIFLEEKNPKRLVNLVRKQNAKEFTKRKVKRMKWQAKKKHQELDQKLERNMRERDELEILKMKLQKQRDELEEKQEDSTQTQHYRVHINEMTRTKSDKRVSFCLYQLNSNIFIEHFKIVYKVLNMDQEEFIQQ